jgi:hypothetical protein
VKYPTRNGLIIPPSEIYTPPTQAEIDRRGMTQNHHGYWPRANFNGDRISAVFRGLISNVYPLLTPEHMDLHIDFSPPIKPKHNQMVDVIDEYAHTNGVLNLVREKKTRETYQIATEQWNKIRNNKL